MTILTTARLRLEPITEAHFDGLHAMNSDPAVMRYISGAPASREDTLGMIERVKARWDSWGYSWWALIDRDSGELVGAGGVQHLGRDRANPLEVGWRLRQQSWGRGYASEAAAAMAAFAFDTLGGELLCAICHPDNRKSARVMERLGMRYKADESWDGMLVSVYDITRAAWHAGAARSAGAASSASSAPGLTGLTR